VVVVGKKHKAIIDNPVTQRVNNDTVDELFASTRNMDLAYEQFEHHDGAPLNSLQFGGKKMSEISAFRP
jgi:hypothetical protein